jgi:predicted RNA-binding Zn-ribbon protein involved in translation (DUF1610 family)
VHDLPAKSVATDYQWPTCTACGRNMWVSETSNWACGLCRERTAERLTELPGLFARINSTAALVRGSRRGTGMPTGSRVPPIPANAEVLNLAATGGVATRLQVIEDAWRQTLGWTVTPWRGNAGQSLPKQVEFLTNNLGWACERYAEVGQDVEEIRRVHAECTAALSPDRRIGPIRIGACPVLTIDGPCGRQLTASTRKEAIKCQGCGTEWPDREAWEKLRDALRGAPGESVAA